MRDDTRLHVSQLRLGRFTQAAWKRAIDHAAKICWPYDLSGWSFQIESDQFGENKTWCLMADGCGMHTEHFEGINVDLTREEALAQAMESIASREPLP